MPTISTLTLAEKKESEITCKCYQIALKDSSFIDLLPLDEIDILVVDGVIRKNVAYTWSIRRLNNLQVQNQKLCKKKL